ncbi:SDR family NAD(P)-dependent oxidoreductase [Pedobacter sp. UBA5917]|jgi:NAD(P)-dependent dehydrogenase (short-subunit alcohol dehydrogenase family)|uniref:SDR family NAD(P)-dependent oxidoreductase n=1 Tax=Pedobacter sp. UBA5917 TaxID=1947061 RepID=UPI0025D4571D|nr:SDR family oxidoreductase [Pedobacter sp. UBA5917]
MLENKVVVLTGGGNGIGWECAKAYVKAGATLCIIDKNPLSDEKLAELINTENLVLTCNLTDEAAVAAAFNSIIKKYERIDAIHNNAAIAHPSKTLDETSNAEWDLLMDVNLKSILYTTRYGIAHLKKSQGCILNTSSMVGSIGQDNHAVYVATKGAINALTKAMALDYAPFKIRVNAVSPAAVNTPTLQAWSEEQSNQNEIETYLNKLQPLGDMPAGDVIADACVFLLSHAARFITGTILPVSGGAELGYRTLI